MPSQRGDGPFQNVDLSLIAGRHELERDRGPAATQQLGYSHSVGPILVAAGTRAMAEG
jgi:hypothetical protein